MLMLYASLLMTLRMVERLLSMLNVTWYGGPRDSREVRFILVPTMVNAWTNMLATII